MWTILKVIIEFVSILLLFYVLVGVYFATRHVGFLLLSQELNLHALHWKASPNLWTSREVL